MASSVLHNTGLRVFLPVSVKGVGLRVKGWALSPAFCELCPYEV